MSAAEMDRDWQTGTVLDAERTREYVGTSGTANTQGTAQASGNRATYQGQTTTSETAIYRAYNTVVVEGETHVYVARQRKRWRWSKVANVTVNAPVQFAVEKRKLYLLDDNGEEHQLEIVKQVLKQKISTSPEP